MSLPWCLMTWLVGFRGVKPLAGISESIFFLKARVLRRVRSTSLSTCFFFLEGGGEESRTATLTMVVFAEFETAHKEGRFCILLKYYVSSCLRKAGSRDRVGTHIYVWLWIWKKFTVRNDSKRSDIVLFALNFEYWTVDSHWFNDSKLGVQN